MMNDRQSGPPSELSVLREMAEESRRSILSELLSGSKSVGELVASTRLKQPNVSNHLAKLREKGLVRASKQGRHVFYALSSPMVRSAVGSFLAPSDEAGPAVELGSETVRTFARAAVGGDEFGCTQVVDGLLRQGETPLVLYQELFAGAMNLVGKWFDVEAIDEGQEHLASAIVERLMARTSHRSEASRPNGLRALLGCVPQEHHCIGLRMLADTLRLAGWHAVYLGANVPRGAFSNAVREHAPDLVLLSCSCENLVEPCLELLREFDASRVGGLVLGAGGWAVNQKPQRFLDAGADFTSSDVRAFVDEDLPRIQESCLANKSKKRVTS